MPNPCKTHGLSKLGGIAFVRKDCNLLFSLLVIFIIILSNMLHLMYAGASAGRGLGVVVTTPVSKS